MKEDKRKPRRLGLAGMIIDRKDGKNILRPRTAEENIDPRPEVAFLLANLKAPCPTWRSCARMPGAGRRGCSVQAPAPVEQVYGAQYHTAEIVTRLRALAPVAGQARRLYRGNHRRRHREEMGAVAQPGLDKAHAAPLSRRTSGRGTCSTWPSASFANMTGRQPSWINGVGRAAEPSTAPVNAKGNPMIYIIHKGRPHSDHALHFISAPDDFGAWFNEIYRPWPTARKSTR